MAESRATFTVRGVESDQAGRALETRIDELEGVMGSTVDRETGEVQVRYDEDLLAESRIPDVVREAGYEVS